jgi:hypothetical protein
MTTIVFTSEDKRILLQYVKSAIDISKKLEFKDADIEVETRFNDVDLGTFERVKARFHKLKRGYDEEYTRVDYIRGEYRYSTTTDVSSGAVSEKSQRKIKGSPDGSWLLYNKLYPFRTGVAIETDLTIFSEPDLKNTQKRQLKRVSFNIPKSDPVISIDCTEVTFEGRINYEIEIDMNLKEKDYQNITDNLFNRLIEVTKQVLAIIEDTEVLYTIQQGNEIVALYNNYLDVAQSKRNVPSLNTFKDNQLHKLSFQALVQARNLKIRDLVWGGLLGGKCRYYASIKANGFRRALAFTDSGIWLLYPPRRLCLLAIPPIKELVGVILDTEDIPLDRRQVNTTSNDIKAKHFCTPFDIMVYRNSIEIQSKDLLFRMKRMQEVIDIFMNIYPNHPLLHIESKPGVLLGPTADDFFKQISLMDTLVENHQLPYEVDGQIITPVDAPYNPHTDKLPLYKRVLTSDPDVCKIKKWQDLTMDFITIKPTQNSPGQLLGIRGKELIPFNGTLINPFNVQSQVEWNNPLMIQATDKSVIEYKPLKSDNKIVLTPIIIRTEKPFPNSIEIIEDIWEDINRPIRTETLHGSGIDLMRYYHNNIKRDLWSSISQNSLFIDIGSGNGGDAAKWRHLYRGLAIEPDNDHFQELQRRIDLYSIGSQKGKNKGNMLIPLRDRVKAVHAAGQNAKVIIHAAEEWLWPHLANEPSRPLVFTSMLSLSFFEKKDMDDLSSMIKGVIYSYHQAGGTGNILFKFFTIEGDAVRTLIQDRCDSSLNCKIELANTITIIPQSVNSIYINIKDTIVNNQIEYLVNVSNLFELLNTTELNINRADAELFMNNDEKIFSSLFIYGTANINAEQKFIDIQMESREDDNENVDLSLSLSPQEPPIFKNNVESLTNTIEILPTKNTDESTNSNGESENTTLVVNTDETPIHIVVGYPNCKYIINPGTTYFSGITMDNLEIAISPNDDIMSYLTTLSTLQNQQVELYRCNCQEYGSSLLNSILKAILPEYREATNTNLRCALVTKFRSEILNKITKPLSEGDTLNENIYHNAVMAFTIARQAFYHGFIDLDIFEYLKTKWPYLDRYAPETLFNDINNSYQDNSRTNDDGTETSFIDDIFPFYDTYYNLENKPYTNIYYKQDFISILNGDLLFLGFRLSNSHLLKKKNIIDKDMKIDPYTVIVDMLKRFDELDEEWLFLISTIIKRDILIIKMKSDITKSSAYSIEKYLSTSENNKAIILALTKLDPSIKNNANIIGEYFFDLVVSKIEEINYTEIDSNII